MHLFRGRHPAIALLAGLAAAVRGHTVISYPGWRGDNLVLNGSVEDTNGLGVGISDSGMVYPYGMQWIYPCGGMPLTSNRTTWPVTGGAVAFQPGWFRGHSHAQLFVNMGFGAVPMNYSVPLVAGFAISGPQGDDPYPGTVCLPQVPVPAGYDVRVGDLATIQVVEIATHGAAMYSCVDITFADAADVAEVNEGNCFNSTNIIFDGASSAETETSTGQVSSTPTSSLVHGVTATGAANAGMDNAKAKRVVGASLFVGLFGMF
ncbi:Uu.00g080650.m01.CDS01 [Anthostomella pinea]|uniref:Uu.00g080650.m01.CDS01 n=1 Tax=Anthostomella pinea TaxID=933095 RepID=A0AAI8VL04_9PEZI|nr:Uu.00g080650.m01.CDS01 [Anthostomella pinea]